MAITYELVKTSRRSSTTARCEAFRRTRRQRCSAPTRAESNETARHTLRIMLRSADAAQRSSQFICSDAGVPVFFVRVGTQAQFSGNVRQAIADGFDELVGDHPAAATAARHQPADAGARLQGQGHADRDVRPRRRRRTRRHHLLAEGARLRPLGGARDLQLPGSRDDREVRARDRDPRRLAALSAGGHRRRHRRHASTTRPSSRRKRRCGRSARRIPSRSWPTWNGGSWPRSTRRASGPMGTGGDSTRWRCT